MTDSHDPSASPLTVRRASFFVLMVGVVAYLGAMDNDFVAFDDFVMVTRHPYVSKGLTWAGLHNIFTVPVTGNWTPLAWLSAMIDIEIYGLWAGGHHLTAVLLHAGAAAGLVAAFHQKRPLIESFACGLVFAIHPVHVESVAWVAERRDVLSMVFFTALLGVWLNDAWRTTGRGQIAVLLLLVAALWSKSTMVTVPAVLVLVDVFLLDRRREGLFSLVVREKWPLWAASAIVALFTAIAQEPSHLASENIGFRLVGAIVAYGHYVQSFLVPHDLAVLYPRPMEWPTTEVLAAVATVVGTLLAAAVAWRRTRNQLIPLGILWFGGTLVPMIGILQVGGQAYADRYLYLSSLGLFFMAWGTLDGLCRRGRDGATPWFETPRSWPVAAAVAWCLSLTVLTVRQVEVWSDNDTLWWHALETGNESIAALQSAGNTEVRRGNYTQALSYFRRVKSDEMPPDVALSMAYAEYKSGSGDKGRRTFIRAIEHGYEGPAPHYWLGRLSENEGRYGEALMGYRVAIGLGARGAAWIGLGRVAIRQGRPDLVREADNALGVLAQRTPIAFTFTHAALAWYDGRLDDARVRLDALLALEPNIVDAIVFRALLTPTGEPRLAMLRDQVRELEGQSARHAVLQRLADADAAIDAPWSEVTYQKAYRDGAWRRLATEMGSAPAAQRAVKADGWRATALAMVVDDALSEVEPSGIDELSLRR